MRDTAALADGVDLRMSNEELQKYWDACLIRCWRKDIRLYHAIELFKLYSGKLPWEVELIRVPPSMRLWAGKPTRVFVARFLTELGNWLFDHPQEQDIKLLNKITSTKYDSVDTGRRIDRETRRAAYRKNKDAELIEMVGSLWHNGEREWDVTKPIKHKTKRLK